MSAERITEHRPEQIYSFLTKLENHWRLGDRYLRLEHRAADGRGGNISIRTPIGLRRTARANVTKTIAPSVFGGTARAGPRTHAAVYWLIEPRGRGARVALEATVHEAGVVDRALLAVGGRRWLRRCFRRVLEGLVLALEPPAGAMSP